MTLNQRIEAFDRLGKKIKTRQWLPDFQRIASKNPWFIREQVELALTGLLKLLNAFSLEVWCRKYNIEVSGTKRIALIMAGNIPMVGFHDLLCVLICGHQALVKLSRKDDVLIPSLVEALKAINPVLAGQIHFVNSWEQLPDALIATGSDNTARYLSYQFASLPKIIRKNRSSHAVIAGTENAEVLKRLGDDMFSYYGKGCRNVSKLWVPEDYEFQELLEANKPHSNLLHNPHYHNNYRYQKSLLQSVPASFIDGGYTLLRQSSATVSPLAVVYYEHYRRTQDLQEKLQQLQSKLQCIVSLEGWFPGSIDMGTTQLPELWDYADQVDTMEFLLSLN